METRGVGVWTPLLFEYTTPNTSALCTVEIPDSGCNNRPWWVLLPATACMCGGGAGAAAGSKASKAGCCAQPTCGLVRGSAAWLPHLVLPGMLLHVTLVQPAPRAAPRPPARVQEPPHRANYSSALNRSPVPSWVCACFPLWTGHQSTHEKVLPLPSGLSLSTLQTMSFNMRVHQL